MSLIQAYITKNFILVGGDTRGTNGDIIVSNGVKKVFKINKNIIELWTIKQLLDACLAKI